MDSDRLLIDRLGKHLGVKSLEDWYKITKKDIKRKKFSLLLKKYGGLFSLIESGSCIFNRTADGI